MQIVKKKIDLAEVIRTNPGCVAIIDNDGWVLYAEDGETELTNSGRDILPRGDGGYGSGHLYGGDILQALASIVGIKVESV